MRIIPILLLGAILLLGSCTSGDGTAVLQPGDLIFRGTVSALAPNSVTFNDQVFDLQPTTQYFLNNNTQTTASSLKVGDYALFAAHRNDNGTLTVTKLQVLDDT